MWLYFAFLIGGLIVVINYQWKKEDVGVNISKNIWSQLNIGSNEDVAASELLTFHVNNVEEYENQDIVTNIKFEAISTSIRKHLFHQHIIVFFYKLELSDQKIRLMEMKVMEIIRGGSYFPWMILCHSVQIVSQCILCQPYSQKKRLMDSVFYNSKFIKIARQLILQIKNWLSCVMKYIICGG